MNRAGTTAIGAATATLVVLVSLSAALASPPGGVGSPETPGALQPAAMPDAPGDLSQALKKSLGPKPADQTRHVPGELIVAFKKSAAAPTRAGVRRKHGVRAKRSIPLPGVQVVDTGSRSVQAADTSLEADPNVRYAEPNYIVQATATIPNDPDFGELWGLNNTGQSHGFDIGNGTADADIDAPEAWDTTTGDSSVKVAIVDTGVAYDHPDLAPNIWANPGESGGGKETNGIDDDGNGKVDDFRGWDFIADDRGFIGEPIVEDNNPRDRHYHGTHVAGTVAAAGNNGQFVSGVAWNASLIPVRVLNSSGGGTVESVAAGFDYAGRVGADIVNASIGGPQSDLERDAVAAHPDTLYVSAAGNSSLNHDAAERYPCDIPEPNMICVAASSQRDEHAYFTDYDTESVDLSAPGTMVRSTYPEWGTVFSEDFETDISSTWITGGIKNTWGRTDENANTGDYSLADSPGANYQRNADSWAQKVDPVDLTGKEGCRHSFVFNHDPGDLPRPNNTVLKLETSTDGLTWNILYYETARDEEEVWRTATGDAGHLDGQQVYVRFRYETSSWNFTGDGVHVDDLKFMCSSEGVYDGDETEVLSGTSMASPHVAGAAALVAADSPGLSPAQIKQRLLRTVDVKPSMEAYTVTGGRLNVRRALDYSPPAAPSVSSTSPASPAADEQPRVIGTAPAGSTVRVYRNANCQGTVAATGTAGDFASPGLEVRLAKSATASFYANATTDSGGISDCSSSSVSYTSTTPKPFVRTVLKASNRCKITFPGEGLVGENFCYLPPAFTRWSTDKNGKLASGWFGTPGSDDLTPAQSCPGLAYGMLGNMKIVRTSDRVGNGTHNCKDPDHTTTRPLLQDVVSDSKGRRIVFAVDTKMHPALVASKNSPQVFMYQKGKFPKQITSGPSSSHGPGISGDGKTIAYSSNGNPTGGNADGNFELFAYEPDTGERTQVTDTGSCFNGSTSVTLPTETYYGPAGASVSADGDRIAFISTCDLTGDNAAHEWRPFVYQRSTNTMLQLDQCSSGCNQATNIAISGDGSTVAVYDRDGLAGLEGYENMPDGTVGGADMKTWLTVHKLGPDLSNDVSQSHGPIQDADSNFQYSRIILNIYTAAPTLSYDGRRIAFLGGMDPHATNLDRGLEIFLLDDVGGTPTFTQLTDFGLGDMIGIAMNEKGSVLYGLTGFYPIPKAWDEGGVVQFKLRPLK